jgi:hypothetical protein
MAMQIDPQVEPLVRAALGAAVDRDPAKSEDALRAIMGRGDGAVREALDLALAIGLVALFDIHDGVRPTDNQLQDLAESFTQMESWAEFDHDTALTFLTALADQRSPEDVLAPEVVVRLVFVAAAWLLAGFLEEDEHWYDYLDKILNTLESAPAQQ